MKKSMWRAPLRHSLQEPHDAAALARIRREVLERAAPSRTHESERSWLAALFGRAGVGRGSSRVFGVVVACTLTLSVVAVVLVRSGDPGRLLTSGGAEFSRIEGKKGGESVRFTDGSRLAVERGARVVSLASTPNEFAILLEHGHVDVEVTPGGPRRWIVEAKWARVEVVGTRFSVERNAERVVVQVREGAVVVRGASLAEGVARVTAGQSIEVRATRGEGRGEGSSESAARLGPGPDDTPESSEGAVEPLAEVAVIEPRKATSLHPAKKDSSEIGSAERLFELADEARARGEWSEAEELLERLVRVHRADPRAALAAYTLGVVRVRQGRRGEAVSAFESALQLAPSRSLREDTLLRLIETEFARGATERAEERAREYRAWFPSGRHLGAIERMLNERETP